MPNRYRTRVCRSWIGSHELIAPNPRPARSSLCLPSPKQRSSYIFSQSPLHRKLQWNFPPLLYSPTADAHHGSVKQPSLAEFGLRGRIAELSQLYRPEIRPKFWKRWQSDRTMFDVRGINAAIVVVLSLMSMLGSIRTLTGRGCWTITSGRSSVLSVRDRRLLS
jgi:hypothetical protein